MTTPTRLRFVDGPGQAMATLFDEAPFMMHSIDASGRIVDVNQRWLEMMGYVRDEVIGRLSITFLTEESRARARLDTLPLFGSTGSARSVAYQFVTSDGRVLDTLLDAELIPGDSGQPVTIAVIRVDRELQDWRLARSILAAAKALMTTWHQLGSATSPESASDEHEAAELWRSSRWGNDPESPDLGQGPDGLSVVPDWAGIPHHIRHAREIRPASDRATLTLRELEVLRFLGRGLRNKEIADELGVGIRAVKFHAENLYSKLGTHTRAQAVRVATERGLLNTS